ncbi:hypothetical protein O3P69_007641 [Scylla paramamosain]|uniref:small monomeric GTPase n=1 Tax=Scylla paramamosain TaxID=85552 RepID=A0AAW0V0V0_SCYPA
MSSPKSPKSALSKIGLGRPSSPAHPGAGTDLRGKDSRGFNLEPTDHFPSAPHCPPSAPPIDSQTRSKQYHHHLRHPSTRTIWVPRFYCLIQTFQQVLWKCNVLKGISLKRPLIVRYITRRYIGEYDSCQERVYSHTAIVDADTLALEILDSAGQSHETDSVRLEANIRWADVFILMYSVTDKCSFDDCNRLKFLINYNKRKRRITSPTSKDAAWEVPVVLVGNKKDQAGDRMVSSEEGFKRSRDIGCQTFHEISVRESIDEVSRVFEDAVRYWREIAKAPKLRRASSDLPDLPAEPHKISQPPISVPASDTQF